MKKTLAMALMAVVSACSNRSEEPTGPSAAGSRVTLSGTLTAAATGQPIRNGSIRIVDGANAGRQSFSNDVGHYELADVEPGTLTLLFDGSEFEELRRIEEVRTNRAIDVQLEKKGFVLSGSVATQWGEPIGDAGVEATQDGRVRGGGGNGMGAYRIPTLSPGDYLVRVIKFGYLTLQKPATMTGDTTLDFVLDRVRVSMVGSVREAAPCAGSVQDVRVEIISGPDAGISGLSTTTGYQLKEGARVINWGRFAIRASKTGYVPAELSTEVLPPGWSCGTLPRHPESPSCPPGQIEASTDVRQDFALQRTGSC